MDRILIILKKENSPRALSAPALGLNTIIFKHVYWYMQQTQVSVYRTIGPLVYVFFSGICCVLCEPHYEDTRFLPVLKAKAQISCAVTAQLISAFVIATRIVQFLLFLNLKFQASSHLL